MRLPPCFCLEELELLERDQVLEQLLQLWVHDHLEGSWVVECDRGQAHLPGNRFSWPMLSPDGHYSSVPGQLLDTELNRVVEVAER